MRSIYYFLFFLAAFAVLLPARPAQAQTTLVDPDWRVNAADVTWLTQNDTDRGGAYNPTTDHILIASAREGGPIPFIATVAAADGSFVGNLDVTNVAGGAFAIRQVAVTVDGQIFASNATRDAATDPAKIYYWADETSAPVVAYSGDPSSGATDDDSRRFGEALGVSGTGNSVDVYLSSDRNTQFATFNWNRDTQTMTGPTLVTVGGSNPFDGASDAIVAAPNDADALWVNGLDQPVNKISATDGSVLVRISGDVVDFSYDGLAVIEIGDRVFLAAGPGNTLEEDQTFRLVDVTDPSAPRAIYITESLGSTYDNPTRSGFVAFDTQRNNLIVFSTNNALASYPLGDLGTYTATLAGYNEVGPDAPVETAASGEVTATLEDGTLTLSGSFANLSSALMVVGQTGSSAHIHLGGTAENGPVVIPLAVNAAADNLSGTFDASANTFDISVLTGLPQDVTTADVMTAIMDGNAYVNVHTEAYPAGEIRGQILFSPNRAPAQPTITSPADQASITIEGADSQTFAVDWDDVTDPDENTVVYVWQLATDANFENVIYQAKTGTESAFSTLYRVADSLLVVANVDRGSQATFYHRANASDGSLRTTGSASTVTLVRSDVALPTEGETSLPERFAIEGNYPNPFNPSTSIRFDLPGAALVSVQVYDVMGREVMDVPAQPFGAGAGQELQLNALSLPSGTYFYRVTAQMGREAEMQTGRMVLVK